MEENKGLLVELAPCFLLLKFFFIHSKMGLTYLGKYVIVLVLDIN